jgi:hypothetical protein
MTSCGHCATELTINEYLKCGNVCPVWRMGAGLLEWMDSETLSSGILSCANWPMRWPAIVEELTRGNVGRERRNSFLCEGPPDVVLRWLADFGHTPPAPGEFSIFK